jgi:Icc-related predicted phosphoesterase
MRALRRLVAAADVRGDVARLERLIERSHGAGAQALVLVGDLRGPGGDAEAYRAVFKALGEARIRAFWVPGPADAPVSTYLREAFNVEVVFPFLHGVHGTTSLAPGYLVFAGMGGEIVDDPDAPREEGTALRYPGWEAEYRLKALEDLDEYQRVLLFSTPPRHKGRGEAGSEVVAELINTYRPRVAVCAGGPGVRSELLGVTLVVLPGSLEADEAALVDLPRQRAEPLA